MLHFGCCISPNVCIWCENGIEINSAVLSSTDVDVDDCDPIPCNNGGTCTDEGTNAFSCACKHGFAGYVCEQRKFRTFRYAFTRNLLKHNIGSLW